MSRPPPSPTRTDPPFPYPTLFRSGQVGRLAGVRRGTIHRRRPGAVCVVIASPRRAVRRLRHCLLRLCTVKLVLGARIRWRRRRPVLGAVEFGSGGEATGGGELIQKLPSGQIHYTGFFNV